MIRVKTVPKDCFIRGACAPHQKENLLQQGCIYAAFVVSAPVSTS